MILETENSEGISVESIETELRSNKEAWVREIDGDREQILPLVIRSPSNVTAPNRLRILK